MNYFECLFFVKLHCETRFWIDHFEGVPYPAVTIIVRSIRRRHFNRSYAEVNVQLATDVSVNISRQIQRIEVRQVPPDCLLCIFVIKKFWMWLFFCAIKATAGDTTIFWKKRVFCHSICLHWQCVSFVSSSMNDKFL